MTVVLAELLDQAAGVDPESGRAELERVRETVARHGGSAGELPDGAVLAVFGSPVAHEDDCVRALRAAAELRSEGVVSRAGIDTGEVLAAPDATVRGTPVRTAARLKEPAEPGEIALGESTGQLVGDAARLEPLRSGEVQGLRLLEVVPDAPARPLRLDAHLVGRASELANFVLSSRVRSASASRSWSPSWASRGSARPASRASSARPSPARRTSSRAAASRTAKA